jgi:integrase
MPDPPTGHVFRVERAPGPVWYMKYCLPNGRQVQKKLGPAWTERGRPPAGYFTKRLAEDALRRTLDDARRGTLEWERECGEPETDWWEIGRPRRRED